MLRQLGLPKQIGLSNLKSEVKIGRRLNDYSDSEVQIRFQFMSDLSLFDYNGQFLMFFWLKLTHFDILIKDSSRKLMKQLK